MPDIGKLARELQVGARGGVRHGAWGGGGLCWKTGCRVYVHVRCGQPHAALRLGRMICLCAAVVVRPRSGCQAQGLMALPRLAVRCCIAFPQLGAFASFCCTALHCETLTFPFVVFIQGLATRLTELMCEAGTPPVRHGTARQPAALILTAEIRTESCIASHTIDDTTHCARFCVPRCGPGAGPPDVWAETSARRCSIRPGPQIDGGQAPGAIWLCAAFAAVAHRQQLRSAACLSSLNFGPAARRCATCRCAGCWL